MPGAVAEFLPTRFPTEMKKCIAFSAIPGSREAWIPCMRLAQTAYALCQRHSDVIAGVMLGVCVAGIVDDAKKKLKNRRRAERKRLARHRRKCKAAEKARPAQHSTVKERRDAR
jgi:hypothetical protein